MTLLSPPPFANKHLSQLTTFIFGTKICQTRPGTKGMGPRPVQIGNRSSTKESHEGSAMAICLCAVAVRPQVHAG